jgi:hypothetical protein
MPNTSPAPSAAALRRAAKWIGRLLTQGEQAHGTLPPPPARQAAATRTAKTDVKRK